MFSTERNKTLRARLISLGKSVSYTRAKTRRPLYVCLHNYREKKWHESNDDRDIFSMDQQTKRYKKRNTRKKRNEKLLDRCDLRSTALTININEKTTRIDA